MDLGLYTVSEKKTADIGKSKSALRLNATDTIESSDVEFSEGRLYR
jgi:hypothetical protein